MDDRDDNDNDAFQDKKVADQLRAFHLACQLGRLDEVSELLSGGNSFINDSGENGVTALHLAVDCGHIACAILLLERKADPSRVNCVGESPLHFAAWGGHTPCVELIIKARVHVDVKTTIEIAYTPLSYAIDQHHEKCTKLLLDAGAKLDLVSKTDVVIPPSVVALVRGRSNAMRALTILVGVFRKRLVIQGGHIGNKLPRDLVKLLALYVWETRFDPYWASK